MFAGVIRSALLASAAVSAVAAATTWDTANSSASYTYTNANNTATYAGGSGDQSVRATTAHSGTGDWWYDVVCNPSVSLPSTIIGVANASQAMTGAFVGSTTNSSGWWNSGNSILGFGSSATMTGSVYAAGDTIRVRLRNNFLYFGINVSGTVTWHLGDPVAQTGGIDVTTMGALYPAIGTNNQNSFVADFTNW